MISLNLPDPPYRFRYVFLILLAPALLPGCGGGPNAKLDDYLEELEFDRPLEATQEIKVNSYRLPCAAEQHDNAGRDLPPLWVRMKFDLYVVAAEEDSQVVRAKIQRHRGMIDDTVLAICRQSTLDELQDHQWSSLKRSLLDAIRPLLGGDRVRQVTLIYSAPWEPI